MTSFTTFYLSRVLGKKVKDNNGRSIGILKDLLVDPDSTRNSLGRPLVNGAKILFNHGILFYSFQYFCVEKVNGKIKVICDQVK